MNLEIQGHTITLGPKALAFIETAYRAKGEYLDQCAAIYCHDQLALWLAGGKCDPDVTIEGPARFVARYNELGLPMMPEKIGLLEPTQSANKWLAEVNEQLAERAKKMSDVPVASAAPADSEWPKWIMCQGLLYRFRADGDGRVFHSILTTLGERDASSSAALLLGRYKGRVATRKESVEYLRANGYAKVADELERPATAGLQVWLHNADPTVCYLVQHWRVWAKSPVLQQWRGCRWAWSAEQASCCTRITGPEADAAIKEAREQGVL